MWILLNSWLHKCSATKESIISFANFMIIMRLLTILSKDKKESLKIEIKGKQVRKVALVIDSVVANWLWNQLANKISN